MTGPTDDAPDVTYVMAAHNAAPWIEAAISSALAQRDVSLEVVVVDDASRDDTPTRVQAIAARDSRVRLTTLRENRGAAGARNVALSQARGAWIGALDADDLISPERSRRLLDFAAETGSILVADNVRRFLDSSPETSWPMLPSQPGQRPLQVGLADYLTRNRLTAGDANLGFLQPLVRSDFLARHGLRYDERLRIGEDFLFCLRCLAAGAELTILPEAFYQYRIVGESLSRRLRPSDLQAMRSAYDEVALPQPLTPDIRRADAAYRQSIDDLQAWIDLRELIGNRDWTGAIGRLARPAVLRAAARTIPAALARRFRKARTPKQTEGPLVASRP